MKKIILVLAAVLTMCLTQKAEGQITYDGNLHHYKTFGWNDDDKKLYYATDTTYVFKTYTGSNWVYKIMEDAYSTTVSQSDSCFLVAPKQIFHWSCYPYNAGWGGINLLPYKECKSGSSNNQTIVKDFSKPIGVLDIPYYNILITNSTPKYRIVNGISERTFYGCDGLTKLIIPSTIKTIGKLFIWNCNMLDTIVFANTFNEDTIYPPLMDDQTWFTLHPITIVVPCNSYDTFYNYIHSLNTPQVVQMNIIPDTLCNCNAYVIDTVTFNDTVRVFETIYDTIQVYDTTRVYDTIYNTVTYYDTVDVNVYHTHHIYDTTFVTDTIMHNVWNMYYDTTVVNVYDTILVTLYDTIIDTLTYTYEIYDTIYNTITDTIVVTVYDTIYETVYDTIYVFIESQDTFDELRLYPVPTRDYVNVEYNGYLDYRIYDNRGKLLETGSVVSSDRLDLTRYATGTYYFNAKLDNGTVVTKRMIKTTL